MLESVYIWVPMVFYKMIKLKGIINDWILRFDERRRYKNDSFLETTAVN